MSHAGLRMALTRPMDTAAWEEVMATYPGRVRWQAPAQGPYSPPLVDHVSLDSRQGGPGTVMVAHRGAAVDSHDFLPSLDSRSMALAVVSEDRARPLSIPALVCDDSLDFLHWWAAWYLDQQKGLVKIGVTGSSGKTTAKDLLVAALSSRFRTWGSPGNFNSVLGLPLAILAMPRDREAAVFEMAMSAPGEMRRLAAMVRPQHAFIVSLGSAHIEALGSREAIAREKIAIASRFQGQEQLYVPRDLPFLDLVSSLTRGTVVTYGPGDFGPDARVTKSVEGLRVEVSADDGSSITLEVPLHGDHNLLNLAGVRSLCQHLGIGDKDLARGLRTLSPARGRGQVLPGWPSIYLDCYNANPESMRASWAAFMAIPHRGRRVAIVGDMKELGSLADEAHRELLAWLPEAGASRVILCGSHLMAALESHGERGEGKIPVGPAAPDSEALVTQLKGLIEPEDFVFIKGSRSMGLERLVPVIQPGTEVQL